jgi:flagellar assembly factor FliW
MPSFDTRNFGTIAYEPGSVLFFPSGLPGFEQRRSFLPVQGKDTDPLVFLQSLDDPALCFVTLPVFTVDRDYRLEIADPDLETIGLAPGRRPRIGGEVLCLVIVSVHEAGPTANLLAPLVVNLENRLGVQAVASESEYSHQHSLLASQEAMVCS